MLFRSPVLFISTVLAAALFAKVASGAITYYPGIRHEVDGRYYNRMARRSPTLATPQANDVHSGSGNAPVQVAPEHSPKKNDRNYNKAVIHKQGALKLEEKPEAFHESMEKSHRQKAKFYNKQGNAEKEQKHLGLAAKHGEYKHDPTGANAQQWHADESRRLAAKADKFRDDAKSGTIEAAVKVGNYAGRAKFHENQAKHAADRYKDAAYRSHEDPKAFHDNMKLSHQHKANYYKNIGNADKERKHTDLSEKHKELAQDPTGSKAKEWHVSKSAHLEAKSNAHSGSNKSASWFSSSKIHKQMAQ